MRDCIVSDLNLCSFRLTIAAVHPYSRCMEPMQERAASQTRMTIAAVSSLLGIPVPTIRSWERRYGFPVPSRTQGKHRRYSVDEIDQLRMMRDEITRGHSASEAVDIVRRYSTEDRPRAELLDRFLEAAMRLDPAKLRETLMTGSESMGVEETMRAGRPARDARDGKPVEGGRVRHRARAPGDRGRARVARAAVRDGAGGVPPLPARAGVRAEGPAHDRSRGVRRGARAPRMVDPHPRTAHARRRRSSRRCAPPRRAARSSPASEA